MTPAGRGCGRPDRRGGARRAYRGLRLGAGRLRRRLLRRRASGPDAGAPSPCSTSRSPFSTPSACGRDLRAEAAPLRVAAPHRRHRSVLSAAPGRVSRGGNRARRLRLEYRKRPDGRGARGRGRSELPASSASPPGSTAYDFAADAVRARLEDGRDDLGPARDRRRRPGFEGAPRRRARSARPSLSAKRLDRASRPSTAARRLLDRVPHPRRAVHPRSAAGRARRRPTARASSG